MWQMALLLSICTLFLGDAKALGPLGHNLQEEIGKEEYAVYSALLNKMFVEASNQKLIIQQDTSFDPDYRDIPEINIQSASTFWSPVLPSTLRDYAKKNYRPYQLGNSFTLNCSYALATRQEIETCFGNNKDGWWNFQTEYKGADSYITLSRVGFNPEVNQAFVEFEYHGKFGRVCSQGANVVLTKVAGEWEVQKKYVSWIS
jgi:hypothetical protein